MLYVKYVFKMDRGFLKFDFYDVVKDMVFLEMLKDLFFIVIFEISVMQVDVNEYFMLFILKDVFDFSSW